MPERRLELVHPRGTTVVYVGAEILSRPPRDLVARLAGRRLFALSSPELLRLHGRALEPLLAVGSASHVVERPDGEDAKSVAVADSIWRELLSSGGKRDSVLVCFGGGSICDLGGFVAATFVRGIDVVHVPTTLLAQCDAAIGGKTALNLPEAKNSVGAFHHPLAVLCDPRVLATLPRHELGSGLLEIAKVGAIWDRALFEQMERDLDALVAGDGEALEACVAAAAAAKIEVVAEDPEERGARRLLNFGHTLGHALETVTAIGPGRALRHGEAVGYGMLFALRLAARRGLEPEMARRVAGLIERIGLPPFPRVSADALLEVIGRDKKGRESGLAWVLPEILGRGSVVEDLPRVDVEKELQEFLTDQAKKSLNHAEKGPIG